MHEQTNKCVLCPLVDVLEQPGQRQQMVVVDPDEVAWLPDAREFFGKRFIGLEVSFPVRLFRRNLSCDVLPEKVVEKRPKCYKEDGIQSVLFLTSRDKRPLTGLAIALIVSVGDLVIQEYRDVGYLLPGCAIDVDVFRTDVAADCGFEASLVLLCKV